MSDPIVIVTPPPVSTVITVAAPVSTVVEVETPVSTAVVATGGGGIRANYYRGIVNYDGGHADTIYPDGAEHLDGGGAADGSRNPV
jgi:hypothetical protein